MLNLPSSRLWAAFFIFKGQIIPPFQMYRDKYPIAAAVVTMIAEAAPADCSGVGEFSDSERMEIREQKGRPAGRLFAFLPWPAGMAIVGAGDPGLMAAAGTPICEQQMG